MADLWRHSHEEPIDEMRGVGREEAAYVVGWALSCVALIGAVFLVWEFGL